METALVVEVPEAEQLVGAWRAEHDPSAARGVPAHLTLLFPFRSDPDVGVVEELRYFFAGVDCFDLTFGSVGEFPDVVWLAPDPAAELVGLTSALVRRWPDCVPYGGIHDEVIPHLTIAVTEDELVRAEARSAVEQGLPLRTAVTQAQLWGLGDDRWTRLAAFPLAP